MTVPVPAPTDDSADTWRAWYRLALDLRSVAPDCASAPGIDYERLSQRVQSSPVEPDLPHGFGRGHVPPDRVAERLTRMTGRPLRVCLWLRSFGPALEWLGGEKAEDHRGDFLDQVALACATAEDRSRWVSLDGHRAQVEARRRWARAAMGEACRAWHPKPARAPLPLP